MSGCGTGPTYSHQRILDGNVSLWFGTSTDLPCVNEMQLLAWNCVCCKNVAINNHWRKKEILYIYILYRSQVEERQWVCWCRNWFWIGTDQYQAVPAPRAMVTPPLSIIIVNQPLTSRKLRISPRMQSKNICLSLFTDCAAPGPGWAKLPLHWRFCRGE